MFYFQHSISRVNNELGKQQEQLIDSTKDLASYRLGVFFHFDFVTAIISLISTVYTISMQE